MRARTSRHARKHAMHAHRPQRPHCRYGTRYEREMNLYLANAPGPMGVAARQAYMKRLDRMFQAVFLPDIVDCIPPPSRFLKLMLED